MGVYDWKGELYALKSAERIFNTDVLVVGSEGAGATAAIEANKHGAKTLIVTKGHRIGQSGATVTGDAAIAVDSKSMHDNFGLKGSDPTDSLELYFEDIIKGGKYLNNQPLSEILANEIGPVFKDLVDWGMAIDTDRGAYTSSGHSKPRSVIIVGSGTEISKTLINEVYKNGIDVIEDVMITDLLTNKGQVVGAAGLDIRTGEFIVFKAKAVVLTTGGALRVWPIATATDELSGDGHAMAYNAGAELVDVEFHMFLPCTLVDPPALRGVDVPFILSASHIAAGHLLNKFGERFMSKYSPPNPLQPEWNTRDIVSVGSMIEILEGRGGPHGGVYMSLKHLPDNVIDGLKDAISPHFYWRYGGFKMEEWLPDLKKEALECAPASHFSNGGIKINEKCETKVPGLFASGECTGGVHGANRLANNAFTEMLVFGIRSGRFAAEYAKNAEPPEIDEKQVENIRKAIFAPLERNEGVRPIELRKRIQNLALIKVGPVRTESGLKEALEEIENIKKEIGELYVPYKGLRYNREWLEALQAKAMLLVLEMTARAALTRTESRGAHYRRDHPDTDYANWTKNIVVRQVDGRMYLETQPVVFIKLKPPGVKVPYGAVPEPLKIEEGEKK